MKNLIFALICCFCCASMPAAIATPSFNADLYVWARSGLNLRKKPDFKAEKISTIPYGTAVQLIEYGEIGKLYNEMEGEFEGPLERSLETLRLGEEVFYVGGYWVKVKVNEQIGYLFDAYLSNMKPFVPGNNFKFQDVPRVPEGMKDLQEYARQSWGLLKQDSTCAVYGNGASFSDSPEYSRFILPDMTDKNIYLLANFFFTIEKRCADKKDAQKFEYTGEGIPNLNFQYIDGKTSDDEDQFIYLDFLELDGVWIIKKELDDNIKC